MKNTHFETIKLTKVEQRDAKNFAPVDKYPNKYGNPNVQHSYKLICLYVEGVDKSGTPVHFWTPATELIIAKGMLNYTKLNKNASGFFMEHKGESIMHKSCFPGDKFFAIENTTTIIPVCAAGETITVQFGAEVEKFSSRRLSRVKFISKS